MTKVRVGLVQLTSTTDRESSTEAALQFINQAADEGAEFVLTPEVTPFLTMGRDTGAALASPERDDISLKQFRDVARTRGIWLLIGSIAVKAEGTDKLANRSFLISPAGEIAARYDKIHLFDVTLDEGKVYRESDAFQGGGEGVLADTPWGKLGLTICYDLRFPYLYRALAQAGAAMITVPSAFTKWTGEAHWHTLLRARAIETGAFILAPAQVGDHGRGRFSYGHSLVIAPWGEILADAGGDGPGMVIADLDSDLVEQAHKKIPAWSRDQGFKITNS